MTGKTVVTIVRHGETDYNKAGIVQGHLDVPLNAQGVAQARVTGRWFAAQGVRFDEAFSSDLGRARKTAETILEAQRDAAPLVLDERIRERHLGTMQGKRRGDPGSDPSTVEPIPHLRARLWAFWDALFPPTGPEPASLASSTSSLAPPSPATSASARNGTPAAAARQVLYVSHGAAIREFMSSLAAQAHDVLLPATVEKRDTPRRVFEMCLPEAEAHALRTGARRIDNCSRTVIEMDWREEEGRWHGRLLLYADDAHFVDSSRAPSPTANADVVE
ncbi:histidine phosphatase superfamily [Rhodotorula diobovata]|uniref:Histidine phosphatase superfamily n=1 Tax=Rhodotorula diobovata TaxID=5288 RepID=A0A5C5FSB2_9BASI|nr:histidine phosphatase superfamily [Rhodotorula diobovata]